MENDTTKQHKNSREWLQPYQFKKGQSGNPSGRPAGRSLKEYAKDMIAAMTDEERQKFLHGINKETVWKMAEGNPAQDLTSGGEKIQTIPIYGGQSKDVSEHDSDPADILPEEKD